MSISVGFNHIPAYSLKHIPHISLVFYFYLFFFCFASILFDIQTLTLFSRSLLLNNNSGKLFTVLLPARSTQSFRYPSACISASGCNHFSKSIVLKPRLLKSWILMQMKLNLQLLLMLSLRPVIWNTKTVPKHP